MKALTAPITIAPWDGLHSLLRSKNVRAAIQVILASLFIGLCAQIKIPLPFTSVPFTGQPFGVILVGALLGSRKGALAGSCYLLEGSVGLPVWAGGAAGLLHLLGPTGGYRFLYPFQAFFVGYCVEKLPFSFFKIYVAIFLSSCIQLALGSLWLGYFVGFNNCFAVGFIPFIGIELFRVFFITAYLKYRNSRPLAELKLRKRS